jgi:hypothetical protein
MITILALFFQPLLFAPENEEIGTIKLGSSLWSYKERANILEDF